MKYEGDTHSFMFDFTSREQFYNIVHLLNQECGKGNWTIKGRVLKSLKRVEKYNAFYSSYKEAIRKEIVIPAEKKELESFIVFVHKGEEKET